MDDQITRRNFLSLCGRSLAICASSALVPLGTSSRSAWSAAIEKGFIGRKLSPYFKPLDNQVILCELCPHRCEVGPGERGLCKVRENINGKYYSLVYANPCAVHIDPIEKKPFYHVLPESRAFSLATAG
ncbi:MAG: radical SAM protein, partial [Desulfobacterales bacterium]